MPAMKTKLKLLPLSKLTRPFLLKFFADPKKKWIMFDLELGNRRCALGHVYHAITGTGQPLDEDQLPIDRKLSKPFGGMGPFDIVDINNGTHPDFKQRTPRARILAALRAAATLSK